MSGFHPQRILCPTDMSEISGTAVRCGLAWAKRFGAKAFVLAARELALPPRYFTPEQVAALTRQADEVEGEVRADLEGWVKGLDVGGVPFETVIGPGPADRAILRAIHVIKCAADDSKVAGTNVAAVAEMARSFGADLTVLHSLRTP